MPVSGVFLSSMHIKHFLFSVFEMIFAVKHFEKRKKKNLTSERLTHHVQVFFYIDPEFETDPKMEGINNLVLSYTFFKVQNK